MEPEHDSVFPQSWSFVFLGFRNCLYNLFGEISVFSMETFENLRANSPLLKANIL